VRGFRSDAISRKPLELHLKLVGAMTERHASSVLLSHDNGWYEVGQENGGRVQDFNYMSDVFRRFPQGWCQRGDDSKLTVGSQSAIDYLSRKHEDGQSVAHDYSHEIAITHNLAGAGISHVQPSPTCGRSAQPEDGRAYAVDSSIRELGAENAKMTSALVRVISRQAPPGPRFSKTLPRRGFLHVGADVLAYHVFNSD
jgi:hypothetical protein